MIAKVVETAIFSIADDQLMPSRYDYARGGMGKSKQAFITFNYADKSLQHEDGTSGLVEGTLDKLSYQYQLKILACLHRQAH